MHSIDSLGLSFLALLTSKEACTPLTSWKEGIAKETIGDAYPNIGWSKWKDDGSEDGVEGKE